MGKLKTKLANTDWKSCHLIMAGGYDYRVSENVDHFNELQSLAQSLDLSEHISFMRSISDKQKIKLLRQTFCLLYTPTNEHFGIVPIEAMYCEKPVIATNTGGPLETVVDGKTGFLVQPEAEKFAEAMLKLVSEPRQQGMLGNQARQRVIGNFSFLSFQKKLNDVLERMEKMPSVPCSSCCFGGLWGFIFISIIFATAFFYLFKWIF